MEALVVYDGECEFCRASAQFAQRRIRPRARFTAWQETDLAAISLTEHECRTAVQWVDPTGNYSGGRAVARALIKSPYPWTLLGALASLPIIDRAVDVAYAWVADNRPLVTRLATRTRNRST